MSERFHQVFVSSTYQDLKRERAEVIDSLLQLDCIPIGMELFPSSDLEQLTYIRSLIDNCDYYIVISAGKYGSTDKDGISFTEREFEYAVEASIPVLAFVHDDVSSLKSSQTEKSEDKQKKLSSFHNRLREDRVISYYRSPEDLAGRVSRSIAKIKKTHPRAGWIKADKNTDPATNDFIATLQRRQEEQENEIASLHERTIQLNSNYDETKIASLDDSYTLKGFIEYSSMDDDFSLSGKIQDVKIELSFGKFFYYLGDVFEGGCIFSKIEDKAEEIVKMSEEFTELRPVTKQVRVYVNSLRHVTSQFQALGLITRSIEGVYNLTAKGEAKLLDLYVVRKRID